jgi:4-aminobutyrate--pyruvate transaminase
MMIKSLQNSLATKDVHALFHPSTNLYTHTEQETLVLDRGEGIYVYDIDGNRYIEGLSGLWCNALGFGNEELIEAASVQMRKLSYGTLFASKSHEPAILLAEKLLELSPFDEGKVFFGSSGSDANDTQIKIFTYLNNATGKKNKKNFLARKKAYHGITVASASMTGLPTQHQLFDLPLKGFYHTECPHYFKESYIGETEDSYTDRLISSVEEKINMVGPDSFAALIAEPLMGAGGVILPPEHYFPKLHEVLDEYDISLIDDEVICGFGRTGNYWGYETFDMKPASITIAKALSSGYVPISAVIIPDHIYEPIARASNQQGIFGHGYTYSGHPVACAVALKTIEIYEKTKLIDHVETVSKTFQRRLHDMRSNHIIGETRGVGLIGAIEIYENRELKQLFDPKFGAGIKVMKLCQRHGLLVRAIQDTIAICPPLIISNEEVNKLFDILEYSLEVFVKKYFL